SPPTAGVRFWRKPALIASFLISRPPISMSCAPSSRSPLELMTAQPLSLNNALLPFGFCQESSLRPLLFLCDLGGKGVDVDFGFLRVSVVRSGFWCGSVALRFIRGRYSACWQILNPP